MNQEDYTILVVEDNLLMLKMVENMLADIGYSDVVRARNGKEAWEMIQSPEVQVDLVISDLLMPEEDGMLAIKK